MWKHGRNVHYFFSLRWPLFMRCFNVCTRLYFDCQRTLMAHFFHVHYIATRQLYERYKVMFFWQSRGLPLIVNRRIFMLSLILRRRSNHESARTQFSQISYFLGNYIKLNYMYSIISILPRCQYNFKEAKQNMWRWNKANFIKMVRLKGLCRLKFGGANFLGKKAHDVGPWNADG